MNKILTLILAILPMVAMTPSALAQNKAQTKNAEKFESKIYNSFVSLYKAGIPEKIYVQTDKPYYSAGDEVWMKGYLVNSITHTESSKSNFIYVELTDRRDSLFSRIKIKADAYGFHNSIALPNDIAPGEYTLTAYTRWMENWDRSLFFNKKIEIANPIDDAVTLNASYIKEESNGTTDVTLSLFTSTKTPTANTKISYSYYQDGKKRTMNTKVGADELAKFRLPKGLSSSAIEISSDAEKLTFSKTIFVPQLEDKIDVQFFPEGGALLGDYLQIIGFKAIGVDGLGRDIKGALYGEKSGRVMDIESSFKGMGRFMLQVKSNEKYYAMVYEDGDSTKKFKVAFPQVAKSGCTIKAVMTGDKLIYQLITTRDIDPHKVGVLIHSRGKVINSQLLKMSGEVKRISLDQLPEGILTIALINTQDNTPIAERMVFISPKTPNATIKTDKADYAARSLVNLTINVKDGEVPIAGNFALAVTDSNSVQVDKNSDNILSNLLLASDLSGHIENPADYFTTDASKDSANRELLMLTQGWRRFSLGAVLRDSLTVAKIPQESEYVIKGQVKGFFGNKARNSRIVLYNPKTRFLDMYPLNESYKFNLQGLDYPDSTTLIIQALGKSGTNRALTLEIDPQEFPEPKYPFPTPVIGREKRIIPDTYLFQSKESFYSKGGMKIFDIDAVQVTTERVEQNNGLFNTTPSNSMNKADIESMQHLTLMQALLTFPEAKANGTDSVYLRGGSIAPLLYIDEMESDHDFITTLQMSQVEALDIILGAEASVFGTRGEGGVIVVKLKSGASASDNIPTSPSMIHLKQLGYKKPVAFYRPKYDVASIKADPRPDLRTTVYWEPRILIDSTGVAKLSFYTADRASTYDVILEGIAKDGRVIRREMKINRR